MPHFQYVGDPLDNGDGPDAVILWGHVFHKDGASVALDGEAARKAAGNRHFREGMAIEAVAVDVTPAGPDPRERMWTLAELNGVTFDKRWGVPRLERALIEAGVTDGDAS